MNTLKKMAVTVAVLALVAVPSITFAQANVNVGLNYGTGLGLGSKDLRATIASIINVAMGLLGIVAVCIILLGGFRWMTAAGDTGKVDEAKNLIMSGIIGLVIILTSYAIATFVVGSIINAT